MTWQLAIALGIACLAFVVVVLAMCKAAAKPMPRREEHHE